MEIFGFARNVISGHPAVTTENFHGWAATKAGLPLTALEYDPGEMCPQQVQVNIESCGICHSDLSMLDNAWGNSVYRSKFQAVTSALRPAISIDESTPAPHSKRPSSCWTWT